MDVKAYIESGILESYVLGATSKVETHELIQLQKKYPEIADALFKLEADLEQVAQYMSITPPPDMLTRIENEINGLVETENFLPPAKQHRTRFRKSDYKQASQYIEVEATSNEIRIHKAWRWIFATVFILGKIFLITAIYYYLSNRQAQEKIQELKTELRQYKH